MGTNGAEIRLRAVSKRYGEVLAVSDLSVCARPGEVHALIGENGAGKSTALKIMAGLTTPTYGQVFVNDAAKAPYGPREATALGVGMVHQHFMLVEAFTALENLMLGHEPTTGVLAKLDRDRALHLGNQALATAGFSLDLKEATAGLSVGQRQRLEIARVLYRGARAILLDEPTAVLSPVEVDELYATLRRLASGGATVVVVTHRLDEVVRFCDRITVMRRGKKVLSEESTAVPDTDRATLDERTERLTSAIMGQAVKKPVALGLPPDEQAEVLQVRGITVHHQGKPATKNVDLTIRAGEVLGIAGIEGNGQTELVRALAGLLPIHQGSVRIADQCVHDKSDQSRDRATAIARARRHGLITVHEDRHRDEMVAEASVADNLVLGDLHRVDPKEVIPKRMERFNVQPPDPNLTIGSLSGGNQQKVVMARALDRRFVVLILAQPTRGVDVGTARAIHTSIKEAAENGAAVLLISADLNELRALSHRIVVMESGRIAGEFDRDVSDEIIGRAMLGQGSS